MSDSPGTPEMHPIDRYLLSRPGLTPMTEWHYMPFESWFNRVRYGMNFSTRVVRRTRVKMI